MQAGTRSRFWMDQGSDPGFFTERSETPNDICSGFSNLGTCNFSHLRHLSFTLAPFNILPKPQFFISPRAPTMTSSMGMSIAARFRASLTIMRMPEQQGTSMMASLMLFGFAS